MSQTYQQPQVSWFNRIQHYVIGQTTILALQDLQFLSACKHLPEKHNDRIHKIKELADNQLLASVFLSGALVLSTRRYFPISKRSQFFPRVMFDIVVIGCGLKFGVSFVTNSTQEEVNNIKQQLMKQDNKYLYGHMKELETRFGLSVLKQIELTKPNSEKVEQWVEKMEEILKQEKKQKMI